MKLPLSDYKDRSLRTLITYELIYQRHNELFCNEQYGILQQQTKSALWRSSSIPDFFIRLPVAISNF